MTKRGRAEWLLFGATFLWGGTFVVIKAGLADISPVFLVVLRFSLAALFILPFCFRSLLKIQRTLWGPGLLLGLLIFIGFVLQTVGLEDTTASKSAFITSLTVLFTPFFQLLLFRRLPRRSTLIGILIVLVGLRYLTSPEGDGFNRGDFFTLLCAGAFGLHIVLLDRFSKEHDFLQLLFLQVASPALYGGLALFFLETPRLQPGRTMTGALLYSAVFATAVTTYIQTRYQKETTPTRAVLIYTLEPVWAAALGFYFLGESLQWSGLLGALLIICGILFSELSEGAVQRWKNRFGPLKSV